MKVKCIRLFDALGRKVEFSPWLSVGCIYHVMSIECDPEGRYSYGIITAERSGEWPNFGGHPAACFEIISTVVPSNWGIKISSNGAMNIAPKSWQVPGFLEAFYDRDPAMYPIFERERDLILNTDP